MTADPGHAATRATLGAQPARDGAEGNADREPRRAAVLARYGGASSALAPCLRERDLAHALWGIVVPGTPGTGGPSLMGWRGPQDGPMPPRVRSEVAAAIRSPATAAAAWEEAHYWAERAEVHAVLDGPGLPLWVRARRAFLDDRLDALFAMLPADSEAHAAWRRLAEGAAARPLPAEPEIPPPNTAAEEVVPSALELPPLAAIADPATPAGSSDPEPQPGEEVSPRSGENLPAGQVSCSPDLGTGVDAVQSGQPKRTRKEAQAAVRALLGEPLADREIARRVGVSPTTVAALRKAGA